MANPVAAIASVASSAISSRSASKATRAQTQADERRLALEKEMFERQVELQEPLRQLGLSNLNRLASLYGEGGAYAAAPTMGEIQMDPGYTFRLTEGQKALERSAAARGGLLSGSMLKGAQRYGQSLASQEFANAYERARQQRADVSNALIGLGNLGPAAASQIGGAARDYTTGAGQAIGNIGAARASGYQAQGNILQNALNLGLQGYGQYRENQLQPYNIRSQRSPYGP
jgi:hypothetical protein